MSRDQLVKMQANQMSPPNDASTPNVRGVVGRNFLKKSFTREAYKFTDNFPILGGVKKSKSIDNSFEVSRSTADGSSLYEWRTFNENCAALCEKENLLLNDQMNSASYVLQEDMKKFEELFRENIYVLYSEVLNAANTPNISQEFIDRLELHHDHLLQCTERILAEKFPNFANEVSSKLKSIKSALIPLRKTSTLQFSNENEGGTNLQKFRKWLQNAGDLVNQACKIRATDLHAENIEKLACNRQGLLNEIERTGRFLLENAQKELKVQQQQNDGQQKTGGFYGHTANDGKTVVGAFLQINHENPSRFVTTACNFEKKLRFLSSLENHWKRLRLKVLENTIQIDSWLKKPHQTSSSCYTCEPPFKRPSQNNFQTSSLLSSARCDVPSIGQSQPLMENPPADTRADFTKISPEKASPTLEMHRNSDNGYSSDIENNHMDRRATDFNSTTATPTRANFRNIKLTGLTENRTNQKARSAGSSPTVQRRHVYHFGDPSTKKYYSMSPDDVIDFGTSKPLTYCRRSGSECLDRSVRQFSYDEDFFYSTTADPTYSMTSQPPVDHYPEVMTDSLLVNVGKSRENLIDLREIIALMDSPTVSSDEECPVRGSPENYAQSLADKLDVEMRKLFPFEMGTTWKPFGGSARKIERQPVDKENIYPTQNLVVNFNSSNLNFVQDDQLTNGASSQFGAEENKAKETCGFSLKRRSTTGFSGNAPPNVERALKRGSNCAVNQPADDLRSHALLQRRPMKTPQRRYVVRSPTPRQLSSVRAVSDSFDLSGQMSDDSNCKVRVPRLVDVSNVENDPMDMCAASPAAAPPVDQLSVGAHSCSESDRSDSVNYEWDDYKPPKHCENGQLENKLDDSWLTEFADDYAPWIGSAPSTARSEPGDKFYGVGSNLINSEKSAKRAPYSSARSKKLKNRLNPVQRKFNGRLKQRKKILCLRCQGELGVSQCFSDDRCLSADAINRIEKFLNTWNMESNERKKFECPKSEIIRDVVGQFKDSLKKWQEKLLENSNKSQLLQTAEIWLKSNITEMRDLCGKFVEHQENFQKCMKMDAFSQITDLRDIAPSFDSAAESCHFHLKALEDVHGVLVDWQVNEQGFKDVSGKLRERLADCGSFDSLLDGGSFCSGDSSVSDDMKAINNDVQRCKERLAALECLCSRLADVQSVELTLRDDLLSGYRRQLGQYRLDLEEMTAPPDHFRSAVACGQRRPFTSDQNVGVVGGRKKPVAKATIFVDTANNSCGSDFEMVEMDSMKKRSKRKNDGLKTVKKLKTVERPTSGMPLKKALLFALPLPLCILVLCAALFLVQPDATCQGDPWTWFWGFRLDYVNGPPPT